MEPCLPKAKHFFGVHNYLTAFRSADFWKAVRVTVTFVVLIGFEIGLGLIFAVILNNQLIRRSFSQRHLFAGRAVNSRRFIGLHAHFSSAKKARSIIF